MRYRLTHLTAYEYQENVSVSHHLLRLKPRNLRHQECLEHDVFLEPAAADESTHHDFYGNLVQNVTVEGAHRKFTVRGVSVVEVRPRQAVPIEETHPWEQVRAWSRGGHFAGDLEAMEFLFDSPCIELGEDFSEYALPSFTPGRPLLAAAFDLTSRIYRDFSFEPEATTVATPPREVLQKRRGVCQDFAHLQIACLRSLGLPARYVSGYIETVPPPGKPRLAGADASHAWVSVFCPGWGWIDLDPTNNSMAGRQHITVAWGRDYGDVSPVRGVILGSGGHEMEVAVDIRALDSEGDHESL